MEIDKVQLTDLAAKARLGDRECLDGLSRLIEPRLRAYIYRATLDSAATCDLLQEVLLQVIQSISTLENPANFRPGRSGSPPTRSGIFTGLARGVP
jgi:DNA-directed RNA polymerase specialized sigma24 family protein